MLKAAVDAFLNKEVCSTYSPRYSRALQLARSVRGFLERSDDVPAAYSIAVEGLGAGIDGAGMVAVDIIVVDVSGLDDFAVPFL